MIVPMRKVYVLSRQSDRERLLDRLGDLGVVHVVPAEPGRGQPDEAAAAELDLLRKAEQTLQAYTPRGGRPAVDPLEAAREVADIQRSAAEQENALQSLHRQMEQIAPWGDLRLQQIQVLRDEGLDVQFYQSTDGVDGFEGEAVAVLTQTVQNRPVIAVVTRNGEQVQVPEGAERLEEPSIDRPALLAEAARIDAELAEQTERLHALAHLRDQIGQQIMTATDAVNRSAAERSALESPDLFAVQGWVPQPQSESLQQKLEAAGIPNGIRLSDPAEDEDPPTLVEYPRWVRPIQAIFNILGTIPGYREFDLGVFFLIALPIFAAMLFGDGGYGLIFLLIGTLGYSRIRGAAGEPAANLILIFGSVTLLWGILTANFFGVTPDLLIPQGGLAERMGRAMAAVGILWREDPEAARNIIIKISFVLGTIHLVLAHARRGAGFFPDSRWLAEVGWCCLLVAMLGVIWLLFFPANIWMPTPVVFGLLVAGFVLIVGFSVPSRNPLKRLGLGLASNTLPMIGAFSDTMSYIRLMAVGLASYYIAFAFNMLAWQIGASSVWLIPVAVVIVVAAHALNIGLCLIAVFAHGVRLNMLEFSNNAGVQWVGYAYAPFVFQSRSLSTEGDR